MTKVRAAAGTMDFGPAREQAVVFFSTDVILDGRLIKARPARAGFKFGGGTEQVEITGDTPIETGFVVVPVLAAERPFGAFLTGYAVLLRREQFLPFGVGFDDFFEGHIRCSSLG